MSTLVLCLNMRLFGVVVCSVLLAGSINAVQELSRNAGEEYTFNVFAVSQTVVSCHLTTPAEETLDFYPDQPSQNGDRYELLPITSTVLPSCSVTLKNIVEFDSGIWEVAFKNDLGIGDSQLYNLTVIPGDLAKEDEQDDIITWLNPIEFPTRIGQNIDISLSKTAYSEDCYVRKPGGSDVMTTNANIEGVTIHSSSDFVSCRITIGPMDASLLGDWALCGKRAGNNREHRCQLVMITWNDNASPVTQWGTTDRSKFDYAVNFAGTLTPTVVGSGNRITCHIITPEGEDLVIDADSDYPHLKLIPTGSSTCSVAIGPIEASLLGDWTLYGKFRIVKKNRLNEVRLPMKLFLYDEENPYKQAYNVTVRDPVRHAVNLGSSLNVEVAGTGKVDSCQFKTPSAETFDLDSHSYKGASFVNVAESIACRLAIGPFREELLGDWTIIGKFSNNTHFTELQQTFQFSEEDPRNPTIDEDRTVTNLSEQRVDSYFDDSQRLIINTGSKIVGQSCHIRTPGGLQYTIMEGFSVPGVEIIEENGVECGVIVHVLSEDAVGTWTLIARATRKGQPIERRLPFTINIRDLAKEDGITWLNPIEFPTRIGQNIDITLSKTAYTEDCYVRKPGASDFMATNANIEGVTIHSSSDFVSCRITIGPMDASLLGDWALCGKLAGNDGVQDRCQLVRITWNDNASPGTQWGTTDRSKFDYAVNFGGILTPTVVGSGNRITCHIITPEGEDLVIDANSDYPHLKLMPTGSSTCSVAIGPIEASLLGDWTLYGKFRIVKKNRLNEVRLPMNLFLYDEENPYKQAYNVTVRDPVRHAVNLGSSLNVEVAGTGKVDSCQFKTPSAETFDLESHSYKGASFVNVAESIACRLAIELFREELLGDWTIIGKFSNNTHFTELQQTFQFSEEDPRNPIIDEDRTVTNLSEQRVDSYFDDSQRLIINTGSKIAGQSCHIRTPGGLQYAIMEGFSVPGVEVIEENGVECGVIVHVLSEDAVGTWTLIARATRKGRPIERRLPFTINVEGTDTDSGTDTDTDTDSGTDTDTGTVFSTAIDLTRDRSVKKTVGPESAVYCRLVDPKGVAVFDSFGRCTLALDKATLNHHGAWRMVIGSAGKVIAEEHQLFVNVKESEGKPLVTTHVAQEKPSVTVSCSVTTEARVHACKFRDPQGKILLAASGVSEDRYVFHGAETSYQSEVKTHECGLQITNPLTSDLGLWRCAIETEEDTYYGFMAVLCPWALMDPNIAATVQQEPILNTQREWIEEVEDEPVTLFCAVEAAIRYCYFRAHNGTTFSVSPGMSSPDMEYVGAGFEAGECGVRFHGMRSGDSGRWSCHVGLVNDPKEQKDEFKLAIQEAMIVDHFYNHGSNMIVEGRVFAGRALDYCRYVRIDGLGFTTESIPSEYTNSGFLTIGVCQLTIRNPTILDMHPWTVVAKIRGQDTEISKDTMEAILIGGPPTTTPVPGPEDIQIGDPGWQRGFGIFFYVFMSVLLACVVLGMWLSPKKNREWTSSRASAFRRSFQNSFRKQPLPLPTPVNQQF